ncbi:aminotransferase class V-fold PLP-dependent enzyme [uncultured Parolsenella sp.]|uniref:aminotransferase class V-fold PLP-dependent enzyme n=1 Tax=uncultured Parolsenella sp. TaxID=2083008 RepID=UPI0025E807C8|nr:aminotransferase class V-fold PLP-dependent enzyme [uncultured Parolsenella sp.]
MKTYPLYSRTFEEARELQFKVIDAAAHHFTGEQSLDLGDLGVHKGTNRPLQTIRVEHVFADAFDAEDAVLVRGAGTGALRWALVAAVDPGATVLVHDAPIYPTTKVTLDTMGARTAVADFNDDASIARVCAEHASEITGVLIQHSRQKPDDSYELGHVIEQVRAALGDVHIVTDDNYAATKVKAIGNQLGADLATFSCFKLLGPEGVGVVLGSRPLVEKIREMQYSGGSQVQGHEAMAALRGLIYAPVALSITGATCHEVARRLCAGELPHVTGAYVANAESKAVLVEFDEDIADRVLELAPSHGAAPNPVGCESKYEFLPMFYRISATFRAKDPTWQRRMIRINVMRSGPDTVIRILRELVDEVYGTQA